MEKLLTEKLVRTLVKATAERENCRYNTEYTHQDKVLIGISCTVTLIDSGEYVGDMSYENGMMNFSFTYQEMIMENVEMFQDIFQEIKKQLSE